MASNEIFQYSVIPALMSGLSSATSSISVSELLSHGSFGIGTFENMDGEMVVLDSIAYQLKADGSVNAVPQDTKVPFAMVTRFKADISQTSIFTSKSEVQDSISKALPHARNLFALVKLEGSFKKMKQQSVHEYENVKGTITGLRSPTWSAGVSVVGLHAHFIDEDRKIGGHILEMATDGDVIMGMAVCKMVHVQLPDGEDFGSRDLDLDEEGVKKAEG